MIATFIKVIAFSSFSIEVSTKRPTTRYEVLHSHIISTILYSSVLCSTLFTRRTREMLEPPGKVISLESFAASKKGRPFVFGWKSPRTTRSEQAKPDDTTRIKASVFLHAYCTCSCFTLAETGLFSDRVWHPPPFHSFDFVSASLFIP